MPDAAVAASSASAADSSPSGAVRAPPIVVAVSGEHGRYTLQVTERTRTMIFGLDVPPEGETAHQTLTLAW